MRDITGAVLGLLDTIAKITGKNRLIQENLNYNVTQDDFARWALAEKILFGHAIHLTTKYPDQETIEEANGWLCRFSICFFRKVFGTNIQRPAYRERVSYISFLDYSGSKENLSPIGATAYHHHSIIMMDDLMAERMNAAIETHPSKEGAFHVPAVTGVGVFGKYTIQKLSTEDDVYNTTRYACKATPQLVKVTQDAFLVPQKESLIPVRGNSAYIDKITNRVRKYC